jgi:Dolichyl-phosphate-mannose-protein mannosyltransferase
MDQAAGPTVPTLRAGVPAFPQAGQAPGLSSDRVPALAWLIAAAFVAVEVAVSGLYGFMQDELYFVEASRHLAFGYVDQPPLTPLLTRVAELPGLSPTAIRIIPALAGGAVVVAAARFAALFGAGRLGRVLAALTMACTPVLLGAGHVDNTTALDLLAWTVVLLCVTTALLRDRPRWWLGAGVAAGLGLENNNLMLMLLIAVGLGVLLSQHAGVLRTRWPWLGAAIAAAIWVPNLIWQATHGWPQLAMASALHQQNNSTGDYLGGLPAQLLYLGLVGAALAIAGFIKLWRTRELRFLAVAVTVVVIYVLAWVPGKVYYTDGVAAAVLAAGSVATERWIARARRPRLLRDTMFAVVLVTTAVFLLADLAIVPAGDVHKLPGSSQHSAAVGNTVGWPQLVRAVASLGLVRNFPGRPAIGWPQLVRAVAAQDAALVRAGQPPTSIFTGWYTEAAALDVLGSADHLPPVLSGHNAYWLWGLGHASDRTVLVVDALGGLRPYFASCRLLTTYHAPDQVRNGWTPIQIGVCTGPSAGWHTLWPRLKHYQ